MKPAGKRARKSVDNRLQARVRLRTSFGPRGPHVTALQLSLQGEYMTHRARELGLTARRLLMFVFGVAAGGLVVVGAPASALPGQCIRGGARFRHGSISTPRHASIAPTQALGT